MSRHNCLGQTVQKNNVGNWKSEGNSVKCQDVINAQGGNQSRCYSAPLLQEVQLQSLKLAGVLFQTLTQSKRFVWEAVLTRRKKHSPFSYLYFSSFYAFSRVLPNNFSSWFFSENSEESFPGLMSRSTSNVWSCPCRSSRLRAVLLPGQGRLWVLYTHTCLWVLCLLFWDLTWKAWDIVCVETSGWMAALFNFLSSSFEEMPHETAILHRISL